MTGPSVFVHGDAHKLSDTRVRIDPNTPLENLFTGLAGLSGIGLFLGVFTLFDSNAGLPAWVVGLLAVMAAAFTALRLNTDNFYIFDFDTREVLFSRQVLSHRSLRHFMDFGRIAGFTVDAKKQSNKKRTWWEYWVVLVRDDGTCIRMTDGQEGGLSPANRLANDLAGATDSKAWEGQLQRPMRVVVGPYGRVRVTHEPSMWPWVAFALFLVAMAVGIGALAILS